MQIVVSGDATPVFKLPAERYYVTVEYGSASANTEVDVGAAQETQQTLNLSAGYLRLASVAAKNTEPLTRDLLYRVYEAKKDVDGNRTQIAASGDATPVFKLPAGRYYVTLEHRGAAVSRDEQVVAGQAIDDRFEVNGP